MTAIRMLLSFSVDGNVNWKNISIIKQMISIYQFLRHCMEFLFLPKWWPIIKLIIRVSINKRAWKQKWIAWFLSLSWRNALECSESFNSDTGLTKNEETNSCWPQPHRWVTFNSHKNTVGEIFFEKKHTTKSPVDERTNILTVKYYNSCRLYLDIIHVMPKEIYHTAKVQMFITTSALFGIKTHYDYSVVFTFWLLLWRYER